MRKIKNPCFFVKTNLLLEEKGFELLRKFIKNLDSTELNMYDVLDYSAETDDLIIIHSKAEDFPQFTAGDWICVKIHYNYILTDMDNLKKLLSI